MSGTVSNSAAAEQPAEPYQPKLSTPVGRKALKNVDADVKGALRSARSMGRGRQRVLFTAAARLGALAANGDIDPTVARSEARRIAESLYGDADGCRNARQAVAHGLRRGGLTDAR